MSIYKDYYKCLSVKENTKKNGENYLYLKLQNKDTIIDGYIWNNVGFYKVRLVDNRIYAVKFELDIYNNLDDQGYLFLGSSLGKRFSDGKSLSYFDLNINFWNGLFTFGTGKGTFFENGERYFRKKYWGGIGIIPLVLSRDYYIKNELEYKKAINLMQSMIAPKPKMRIKFPAKRNFTEQPRNKGSNIALNKK